jgi:hypothetical protein
LLQIHAQLEKVPDEKTNRELHQALVTAFETIMKLELERYTVDMGQIRLPRDNALLELSCSIEYFWEDELAIRAATIDDYASKRGLWTNDEVKKSLLISHLLDRRGGIVKEMTQ